MKNKVEKIVILGGGTAGWMTASYLKKAFGNTVNISVVESSRISTIGVGEATFSTIKLFFDFLELKESDWMPHCHATYKMAIRFVDWNVEKRHFYHPFQRYETIDGFNIAEWWLKLKDENESSGSLSYYDYSCFTVPSICDNKLSPRFLNGDVFDSTVKEYYYSDPSFMKDSLSELKIQFPYAYHFNAALLAKFLKDYATKRGVQCVDDEMVRANVAEDGSIESLVMKEMGDIQGDLFVDCTGFRGLLINKTLNEPFISFSDVLLCDSAIAMQIPTDIEKDGIKPYTSATALTSGWVWNIPLYGRDGTGYVYSSLFKTQEEAEKEFRKHLGSASDQINGTPIKMRIGRNQNAWVKNVVAIGLSCGFVEPLESTGIFFIQQGIEELVASFPNKQFNDGLIRSYNKAMAQCIDGVKDFLTLHYYASTRNDSPFWKATKSNLKISDELKERVAVWKTMLPNPKNINRNYHGFESYSYSVMLLGLGHRPEHSLPALDHIDQENARKMFDAIRQRASLLCKSLPTQYEYLTAQKALQSSQPMKLSVS